MSGELETLIPQPAAVEVAGCSLQVGPLKVEQIARVMAPLRAVLSAWGDLAASDGSIPYLALMERCGASAVACVAIAVDQPPEWVGGLSMAEHITLATAIVEANPDFFAQLLREDPLLRSLVLRLLPTTTPAAGPTPSPDLSTPATPTATS